YRKLDSATGAPPPWVPAAVHDRQDNGLVSGRAEVHGVRKATDELSPGVPSHAGIGERVVKEQLRLGLRSKYKSRRHPPPARFRRTFSPGLALPGFARCSPLRPSSSASRPEVNSNP